jgi:plasmid replication initiation protein
MEFRELTGTEKITSYDNFGVNRQKVIEPAIKEINEKTDIKMSYDAIKTGRTVTSIKFKVSFF